MTRNTINVARFAAIVAASATLAEGAPVPITGETATIGQYAHGGGTGSVERVEDGWRIRYDFSKGGGAFGMSITPPEPIWAKSIFFDALCDEGHAMGVLLTDSTNQKFLKFATPVPGEWRTYSCDTGSGWEFCWDGPRDRRVRLPIRKFHVMVDRFKRGLPAPGESGDVLVRNVAYEPMSEAERAAEAGRFAEEARLADSPGVRYTVTDFTPGDRFSGGPRAFWADDGEGKGGAALADGRVDVDFSAKRTVRLTGEIPIWGVPKAFFLTVEAPAEAAGMEISLGLRVGGGVVFNSFGKLAPPEPGQGRIVQMLSMPAPCNARGWNPDEKDAAPLGKSKRVTQVILKKGDAQADRFQVNLARLEAETVAVPGSEAPLLVELLGEAIQPAKSEEARVMSAPPRVIGVEYLNLAPFERVGAEIRVAMTDWQGRGLGVARSDVPPVASGGRTRVPVSLPSVPDGLNFVSYDCSLWQGGRPVAEVPEWNICWTRPLPDAGTPDLRPDLPWGMGVYLHRSMDTFAFLSAYASPTNAAAPAIMEKRAALAQAAGVKWERLEFKPSVLSAVKGEYDFSYYDTLYGIAVRHGLSCMGLFSHYWPAGARPFTQEGYDAWIEAFRRTAEHFKGRIRFWEIWNEPNIGYWKKGARADYTALLNGAGRVLKDIDPDARIVAFSTASVDFPYINSRIAEGATFDAISVHPYRFADPEEHRLLGQLSALTSLAHGAPSFLTEVGWPTGCDARTFTEREQAGHMARFFLTAAGSGNVHSIYGYDFIDDGFNPLEREGNFGVLRRDFAPKPAYRALAKVFRTFTEGTPVLEEVRLSGATTWIFRMSGKSAVWATAPLRIVVNTRRPAIVTNLMDEELSGGAVMNDVEVGPLAPLFFDADVDSVAAVSDVAPGDGSAMVRF